MNRIISVIFLYYPIEKYNCLVFMTAGHKDKNHSGNQYFTLIYCEKTFKGMIRKKYNNKTTDLPLPPVLLPTCDCS